MKPFTSAGGLVCVMVMAVAVAVVPATAGAKVLRVGAYHGINGQRTTIQATVNAARPVIGS